MYYLSEAANPPKQKFIDPLNKRYTTMPYYDERYFTDLYNIINVEPIKPQDMVMMGILYSLGIEKGKPFNSDEKTIKAMRQGAIDAYYFIMNWFDNVPKEKLYWADRHYLSMLMTNKNKTFTWEYPTYTDLVNKAVEYFWCVYMPKKLGPNPATQYVGAMADKDGNLLEAGK